jgi:hypothetical protein
MQPGNSLALRDPLQRSALDRGLADALRRGLRVDLLGVRGLTPLRVGGAAVVVALFALYSTIANVVARTDDAANGFIMLYGNFLIQWTISLFPTLIFASAADALRLQGRRRVLALTIALVLGAMAVAPLEWHLDRYLKPCVGMCAPDPGWSIFADRWAQSMWILVRTSAITLAYLYWRRDRETAALLHASEMALVAAERERLEASLLRMQARVDPAFLLGTLHDVGARCEADQASSTRLLDLLIRYLRAALPRTQVPGSTFARESDMLKTFLEIAALRSPGALNVSCRFDSALADAAFPPMVLLPLVAVLDPTAAAGTVDVEARALDGRARVTIAVGGPIAPDIAYSPAIAEVRARLAELYRERASFAVDCAVDGATRLIVEVPHARAAVERTRQALAQPQESHS